MIKLAVTPPRAHKLPSVSFNQSNNLSHLHSRHIVLFILSAVEIVPIHTSPKRKRGNDLATSLALRVSVNLNREQYSKFRSNHTHGGLSPPHPPTATAMRSYPRAATISQGTIWPTARFSPLT